MISLRQAKRIFLDTAPLIYLVERNETYWNAVVELFSRIDAGGLQVVTSPVSLAECLVLPYRKGRSDLMQIFTDLIVNGENTQFVPLDQEIAAEAAHLRGRYNLALSDAFQAAVALATRCDVWVTNDADFKRVADLNVLLVSEL